MFFIVFVLFFSKYFAVNSLRCMTSASSGWTGFLSDCKFQLHINDSIPDDTQLTNVASNCQIRDANSFVTVSIPGGSCYGEIVIDYNTKQMEIKLTHVSALESTRSPYDDMLGLITGIQSVVQYKINGNVEKGQLKMVTRVQCKTADNCALNTLRELLSNLTISKAREKKFEELSTHLYQRDSDHQSALVCASGTDADVECTSSENRCEFRRSKDVLLTQRCVEADPDAEYDLEYRFNMIQEMGDLGIDNSAKALKIFYLCQIDLCNNDETAEKVNQLLTDIALVSEDDVVPDTEKPHAQQSEDDSPKSDAVIYFFSFYSRSILCFSVLLQILSY